MKNLSSFVLFLCFGFSLNAQIINIPDANFKAKLLAANIDNSIAGYVKIDSNNNGEIDMNEALIVGGLDISDSNITDLTGINSFSNLVSLQCNNNLLTSLDLNLTNLSGLFCQYNQLTSLLIIDSPDLHYLDCSFNQLTSLDITNCKIIYELYVQNNKLQTIKFSKNINIDYLNIQNNNFDGFDLSKPCSSGVISFAYGNNPNDTVIFPSIFYVSDSGGIYFSSNTAKSLDLTHLKSFGTNRTATFFIGNSPNLEYINFKNGYSYRTGFDAFPENDVVTYPWIFNLTSCPKLSYICCDEGEIEYLKTVLSSYSNDFSTKYIEVNSYCSFTPGGTFYTIQGNSKLDENNNGCDVSDGNFPNLKFTISDGTNTGSLISDASGNYSIPVSAGTQTITPQFENPSYFSVSPATVNVSFPTQTSPFTQDFCVTANGVHPDLEVAILPIDAARPGFDATYKIIYKNKGNTMQSGSVNLTFNDAVLDFVTANPIVVNQTTDKLTWNFTNLQPFETREILVTVNVNKPTETPAVNNGDVLSYTANIISVATDETPMDNTFVLNQTVVGSYDPNDKTCLEGTVITPNLIGEYVHYMIRFENTGTFSAQNVVVKDLIDLSKFDINSLVPITASHSFVTKISEGNKVEFIFENINLPFDDATNDGYISFKIKTLSTLKTGDSFTNEANIYFDYNFPIVTKPAKTTITALANQDFEFSNYLMLSPNPAKQVLQIHPKQNIKISSVSVYNMLGQLVIVIPNPNQSVDVSSLKAGNYLIKVISDKGMTSSKFVKE